MSEENKETPNNQPNPKGPNPPMSKSNLAGWILLIGLGGMLFALMMGNSNNANSVSLSKFLDMAKNGDFEGEILVSDSQLSATLKKSKHLEANKPRKYTADLHTSSIAETTKILKGILDEKDSKAEFEIKHDTDTSYFWPILFNFGPFLLFLFVIYFFVIRSIKNAGGGPGGMLGNFGRSKHKVTNKEHSTVRLADVAGIQEAKEEIAEIIEFLKNPKKFQRLGGRVPRGLLLAGQPGCGKTLLAKAVAGEADVPFFSISGSDFVEMFVGVGASRVRDLFKQAKESSPCIIFLDEIDAVGRRRGSGFSSGGNDEREQTLNAILVEMDGFETSDQVIVIAATNRSDVLDPALTRPGRFDRQITVPLPDIQGRAEILNVHTKKIKMSPDVDIEKVARGTPMFSGADIAAIVNEAAIIATLANKDFVEQEDFDEARDKIRFGRAQKSRKIEEKERIATAYHEAGHAVLQYMLEDADPLYKVTIIPRGQSLGSTISLPEKDRLGFGEKYIKATMKVLCGGRIAENRKTGDITSGASMDIRMATSYARHMIIEWGMSEKLGFVDYSPDDQAGGFMPERTYSDDTAHMIDQEVKATIDESYAEAERLLLDNWDKVVAIAEALLKYETLDRDDVGKIMKGESLDKPTVRDLLDAEKKKAQSSSQEDQIDVSEPESFEAGDGPMPSPA